MKGNIGQLMKQAQMMQENMKSKNFGVVSEQRSKKGNGAERRNNSKT